MRLFTTPGVCSLACHIALCESGLDFTAEIVDLRAKTLADGSDYRAVNARGAVPALEIAPGEVLTEGVAIMQYVAGLAPAAELAPAEGSLDRARMQEAMNFISGELHKSGYGPLFRPGLTEDAKAAQLAIIDSKLAWLEGLMANGQEYLVRSGYTLADGYLFTISGWSAKFGHDLSQFPRISALRARVAARPAVQAAMRAEGMV
jgi:glutathione S-transferase